MGTSTIWVSVADAVVTDAVKWVGDFAPLIVLVAAVGLVGIIFAAVRRVLL